MAVTLQPPPKAAQRRLAPQGGARQRRSQRRPRRVSTAATLKLPSQPAHASRAASSCAGKPRPRSPCLGAPRRQPSRHAQGLLDVLTTKPWGRTLPRRARRKVRDPASGARACSHAVQGTDASTSANCSACSAQGQACTGEWRSSPLPFCKGEGGGCKAPTRAEVRTAVYAEHRRKRVQASGARACPHAVQGTDANASALCVHPSRRSSAVRGIGEPRGAGMVQGIMCGIGEPQWEEQGARSRCRVRCRAPRRVRKCDGLQEMPGTSASGRHHSRIGAPRCADRRAARCREGARCASV